MVSDHGLNIAACSASAGANQVFLVKFTVWAHDGTYIKEVLERLRDVDNVFDAVAATSTIQLQ